MFTKLANELGHHLVEMLSISPSWPTTGSSNNHPKNGNFHREGDDEPSSWGITANYSMFRKKIQMLLMLIGDNPGDNPEDFFRDSINLQS